MADDDRSQRANKRVKNALEDLKRVSAKYTSKKAPTKKYRVLCYASPTTGHLQRQRNARERAYYARRKQRERRSRNPVDEEQENLQSNEEAYEVTGGKKVLIIIKLVCLGLRFAELDIILTFCLYRGVCGAI